ncbi:MAG: ADP-forming succinate--CoA ligase subunit beta, partial [Actinobacteria bacterium]|nr:ADP-forming succinate--CoA ligase subunit beta [Actinomycetota bacterium]
MDLLEHEGKALLRSFGVRTPRGGLADTPAAAAEQARQLGGPCVVKAQVPIGGRGKAGGILRAQDAAAVAAAARRILAMSIRGHAVAAVLVEEAVDVSEELYMAILLDRAARRPLLLLSRRGGMDIEQLAAQEPDALASVHIDPAFGWSDYVARTACAALGIAAARVIGELGARLWQAFRASEATLLEINPLTIVEGEALALDAKVSVDNAALFRHPELAGSRGAAPTDPLERLAAEKGLPYVRLNGQVGVLGNGAGLVMSTLDLIAEVGGAAANFLDIGGGASAQRIVDAFEVVLADQRSAVVFVNVFGGITRCDEVARGLLLAF